MASTDLRRAYMSMLMKQVTSCEFPSPTMLDRIEQAVRDRDSAEEYVQVLIDQVGDVRYPSPTMLDRLSGLLDQLDRGSAG
jgi:hypothetical protein